MAPAYDVTVARVRFSRLPVGIADDEAGVHLLCGPGKAARHIVFCYYRNRSRRAATRSVAVELHENAEAITAWRDMLPERQRKRLIHPLSVTRRWRASLAHGNGKCPADLKRDAVASRRWFCACVEALPASESLPLWHSVAAEASTACQRSAVTAAFRSPSHSAPGAGRQGDRMMLTPDGRRGLTSRQTCS